MKKCITCGQEIKDDALFCPYCGTRNQGDEQGAATAQDTVQDTSVNAVSYTHLTLPTNSRV